MSENSTKSDEKLEKVFDAASSVFSQYGFRRTSMNDVAQAAGISRPALYLMFENKEDLFRQLARFRQNQAIDLAVAELAQDKPFAECFTQAILIYERVYYEPVSASPHGAELADINLSVASEDMKRGSERLIGYLAQAINDAKRRGEVAFQDDALKPRAFVELLMSSIGGQKKSATSIRDFRRKVNNVASIFMASIIRGGEK
jgi:AcrR family transcriptional regulator